jgi:hypothetical protein
MSKENLENNNAKINRLAWYLMSEFWFGEYLRKYVLDPYMFEGERVVTRNFEASYDVSDLEPSSRKEKTYVLQEYFIPVDKFEEFVPKMKNVFEKYNVNVFDDFLIEVYLDQKITDEIDGVYKKHKNWSPDVTKELTEIIRKRGKNKLVVSRSKKKSEKIRNLFRKYFAFPK